MKRAITMNIVLDKESQKSAHQKRPFTTSQLVRFWLKVLFNDQETLYRMKKEDDEFRAILLYLAPKLESITSALKSK
jgi:hypothetical protein